MIEIKNRLVSIILFLISLGLIGYLTIVNKGNMALSETCRHMVIMIYERLGLNPDGAWWNNVAHFRKIGHVIEYLFLGITAGLMLKRTCLSILICFFISLLDQIVKIAVPLRHFDISDMAFDAIGYAFGAFVVVAIEVYIDYSSVK